MKACPEATALCMVRHFWHCGEDCGRRVAEGAGIDLEKAKKLSPLIRCRLTAEINRSGGQMSTIMGILEGRGHGPT